MTINTQRAGAIFRQALAILGIVFGVLTQTVSGMKLPTWLSAVITGGGALILAIEHYVSDPSTGTPSPSVPTQGAKQ